MPSPSRLLDTRWPRALLLLFCLVTWAPGFFTLPPLDRDESRFAQATKQMLETGDYVRIMNGTEERNRKPVGIYWLQLPFAALARDLGLARANPIWPYRIPSALGGLLAVFATFELGRTLVGRRAALLAALTLAGSVILAVETGMATTDGALLGATTLAMLLLARACQAPDSFGPGSAALFWLAIAAGILLKGPVTPMVVGLAGLTLAIWDRAARRPLAWLRHLRPVPGIALLLLAVLPWFVAIGFATHGLFFAQAVGGDLGRKLTGGDDAHGAPPGSHLLLLPLLAFPASLALLSALPAAWRGPASARRDGVTRLLVAWVVPSWVVFELVPTKLPHYTLPLYPALFLLAARWLLDPLRLPPPRWLSAIAHAAFAVAATVLAAGALALPPLLKEPAWLGLAPALLAAAIAWIGLRRGACTGAVLAGLAFAVPFYWSVLQFELSAMAPLWLSPRIAAALPPHPGGFATVGYNEPSLMFLAGTNTRWLSDGAAAARFLADGENRVVGVDARARAAFAAEAQRLHLQTRQTATIRGLDYSNGHRIDMAILEPADAAKGRSGAPPLNPAGAVRPQTPKP
ncbi:MAG TPA: glycosyltransferase family 39 protein [Acetobacteraceae bacterium]|nr:glycosyltransferase family 39 protein [Acetobacteraceae bacterium]